jgi:hypothetical protein
MLVRRRLASATVGCMLVCALAECSPFGAAQPAESSDAQAGGPDVGKGRSDASTDASLASEDNLLTNPSFESGCDPWGAWNATVSWSPQGRTRGGACFACVDPRAYQGFSINSDDVTSLKPGKYKGSIWVRARSAPTVSTEVRIVLRTRDANNRATSNESDPTILTEQWQQITVTLDVTAQARRLDIYAWIPMPPATAGTCFLADDASVVFVGP